jgi:hypothetical protein
MLAFKGGRFGLELPQYPMRAVTQHAILAWVALIGSACSNLTDVKQNGITQPSDLNNPSGALVRRAGAISQFTTALSLQALYSGIITDEFSDVGSVDYPADTRRISPITEQYPYDALSGARVEGLLAIDALRQYAPSPAWHIAELYAMVGFVETYFAEDMCSGVPLGVLTNGSMQYGPTSTRHDLIVHALADFDSAAHYASGSDSILSLARIGKARALLDSGDFASAAAVADSVSTTFAYAVLFDGATQINSLFLAFHASQDLSVSDVEGQNGLNFISAADPRVAVGASYSGQNGGTVFPPAADSTGNAPVVAGSEIEARLIAAEAALRQGDISRWAVLLDSLRASWPDTTLSNHPLPPDSTTLASDSQRVDVMFRERAFWLFGTGHRQGDLRRLIRQYGRATESVFPTGPYATQPGTVYGTDVVFVPFGEQYNPNYAQCFDHSP